MPKPKTKPLIRIPADINGLNTVKFKGAEFQITGCGSSDPAGLFASFLHNEKEIRERWWNVKKDDIVLDIGSNFGSYTLSALALGAWFVVSIDPSRDPGFDLNTNIILNGYFQSHIHLNHMIGSEIGVANYFPNSQTGLADGGNIEKRVMYTVDAIVSMLNIPKLDWIKIDVEGMEMDVLKGAFNTLNQYKPKMLIENHEFIRPGISDEIKGFMNQFGYKEERDDSDEDCWYSYWESNSIKGES